MTLKVIDLFCGSGGISEGLRQAGFNIIFGVDKDKWSVETFKSNHHRSKTLQVDLKEFDPKSLPACDVLVGGPPCVQFSTSKSNKTRNILEGLLLVQSFLKAVYFLKPKYWFMENVPKIADHLPKEIPLSWIGINKKGNLLIPNKNVFTSSDFGVPQIRKRYIIGKYPTPLPLYSSSNETPLFGNLNQMPPWKTFGQALSTLPSPYIRSKNGFVTDFNYNFKLSKKDLTDHFYDSKLNQRELKSIKKAKTEHPFYGFLPFPDELHRPARTVVATQLGRETLIIEEKIKSNIFFRRPTVRECAVIQSFPISYQFFGNNYSTRYRLVGDAVPPLLAFYIGNEINKAEGKRIVKNPKFCKDVKIKSPLLGEVFTNRNKKKAIKKNRKFAELVPGKEIRGCRAELDNRGKVSQGILSNNVASYSVNWVARLYVGEGKGTKSQIIEYEVAKTELININPLVLKPQNGKSFLKEIEKTFEGKIPNSIELQKLWADNEDNTFGPYEIIEELALIINKYFPKKTYANTKIIPSKKFGVSPKSGIRIRILAGLIGASFIAKQTKI